MRFHGAPCARVHRVQKVVAASRQLKKGFSGLTDLSARGFLSLTAPGAEGCGIAHGATTWQGSGGFRRFKGFREWWYRPAGDEYEVSVTEFTFVYQVLQNEELKPLPWEGACRRQATEEQRGLDDRSQKSDVRMRYVLAFPPGTVILSRRRRILVHETYEANTIKYQSAGRLLYA